MINGSFRVKKLKKIDPPKNWFFAINYHQWTGLCWFGPFYASHKLISLFWGILVIFFAYFWIRFISLSLLMSTFYVAIGILLTLSGPTNGLGICGDPTVGISPPTNFRQFPKSTSQPAHSLYKEKDPTDFLFEKKWPEELRRYASTRVIQEWSQMSPRVVPEWSQTGPKIGLSENLKSFTLLFVRPSFQH